MAAEPWATILDVQQTTGRNVSEAVRNIAAQTIELHVGLIEQVERTDISGRDRYFLKLAVCYQAAWVAAAPDLFERSDVSTAGQDGESAAYRPDAHTLAPLARKAIKRLSWRGPRVLGYNPGRRVVNINSDEYEETLDWKPVG